MKLTKHAKQDFYRWIESCDKYKDFKFSVCPLNGLMMKEKPVSRLPALFEIMLIYEFISVKDKVKDYESQLELQIALFNRDYNLRKELEKEK